MTHINPSKMIVIITQGSRVDGMGHVYRAISLGRQFETEAQLHLLISGDDEAISFALKSGFNVVKYDLDVELLRHLLHLNPNVVVIDRLVTEESTVQTIHQELPAAKLVTFDNMESNANKHVDIVVNALISYEHISRGEENKSFFDSSNRTLYFCGPKYLFLRDSFSCAEKRSEIYAPDAIKHILITFGGGDPSNFTALALKSLLETNKDVKIDLVLGPLYPDDDLVLAIVQEYAHIGRLVRVYKNYEQMERLIVNADIMVTSPGLTMFEALVMRVPVIAINQSPLQKKYYANFPYATILNSFDQSTFLSLFDRPYKYFSSQASQVSVLQIGEGVHQVLSAIKSLSAPSS